MTLTGSSQWPAVDELKGFSGHVGFNLEREREREKETTREAMNEKNDRRKEGKDNGGIKGKTGERALYQEGKTPNKMYELS